MDPVKRKIILTEIEHWRRSKLLPEQYCDFLHNLYVDRTAAVTSNSTTRSAKGLRTISAKGWLYSIVVFGLILMAFLYFTSFPPLMQTGICLLVIFLVIGYGISVREARPLASFTAIGIGCLLSLFLGLLMINLHDQAQSSVVVTLVAFCGLLWVAVGFMSRIGIVQLCGYFALLLGYISLIQRLHPEPDWLLLQGYALPVCLVMYLLGKRLYNGIGSAGSMMLAASCFLLAVPEIYGLAFTEHSKLLLIPSLAVKIGLSGLLVWRLLKRQKSTVNLTKELRYEVIE